MSVPENILAKLLSPDWHVCAKCLCRITRGVIAGRQLGGTKVWARCHGRVMSELISDRAIEDNPRWFWFDGTDGKPYESPAVKRKRELAEDLARVRAARAMGDGG